MPEPQVTQDNQAPVKIMFAPMSYMLSHVCRCVEIGKILRDWGHEVVFAVEDTKNPRWSSHIAEKNGFRCVRVREQDYGYIWDTFEKGGWIAVGLALLRLRDWTPLDEIFEGYVQAIEAEEPDIICGDGSIAASNAAYVKGIPAAGIMNAYAGQFGSWPSPFMPMIHAWDFLYLARLRNRVYRKYDTKPVNALKLVKSIPMISPDIENLYTYPKDFNWKMVGPILSEPPCEMPDWYDEIHDGKTNIYLSLGTTGMLDALLNRTYDAFSKTPYRFITTTGGQAREETLSRAPDNFRIAKYAPGRTLLKHCSAIIFHGGNGTMYQALEAGVPMIALWNQLEQRATGRMVKQQGFGFTFNARKVRPEPLVEALDEVVNNPKYRENVQRFSPAVAESRGAERSAELLVDLAREGEPAGKELV